jgi:hypothetical protein
MIKFGTLTALVFLSSTTYGISFLSTDQLFLDALQKGYSSEVSNVSSKATSLSASFSQRVEALNHSDTAPVTYKVSFSNKNSSYECLGSVLLNSSGLNVARIPVEYRDRAGLVVMGECLDMKSSQALTVEVEQYVVLPLNKTLPILNGSAHEAYEVYKKLMQVPPSVKCSANDVNSQQVPRTQTYVHDIDSTIVFSSIFNTSSVMRDHSDGSVSHIEDRAMRFEGDVDRGSLFEIQGSLDLLVDKLKGHISIGFDRNNCTTVKKEDLYSLACYAPRSDKMSSLKDHRGIVIDEVYAQFESFNVDRIILGVRGASQVVNEKHFKLNYTFVFGVGKERRVYKIATQYRKSPIGSVDECRIK